MDKLVLRSTFRGNLSVYFWCLIWIGALYVFNLWIGEKISSLDRYDFLYPLAHMIFWASYGVMAIVGLSLLWHLIYAPLTVHTFFKDQNGLFKRLVGVTFDFPFSLKQEEIFFDRIVDAKVKQASIDRIFGTGTITFSLVAFTNGEVYESVQQIPAINDPFVVLQNILNSVPSHTGLEVRWTKELPAAS